MIGACKVEKMSDEYLTVKDVQKILKFSRTKTYQLVSQPDFPKTKIGREIRIPRVEFEKFMRQILYKEYRF